MYHGIRTLQLTDQIRYYGNSLRPVTGLLMGYLTTLFQYRDHIASGGMMMNWKGYIRKWPWPNRGTIPAFAWRD
jgi:hypothetical protein